MSGGRTLCLLGAPAVRAGDSVEELRLRPKEWALLARVALAGGTVQRSELAELLVPEADDPRRALRWHLNALRAKLPPEFAAGFWVDARSIGLNVPTDVAAFLSGVTELLDGEGSLSAPDVLKLYRGDLCQGLSVSASPEFDVWLYVEQEGLRRQLRQATLAFARWAGAGQQELAIPALSRLVAVDRYCEDAHILLVQAYEALGERDAARAAYQTYERIVRDELHAEPQPAPGRRSEPRSSAGRSLPRDELVALDDVTVHMVEWPGDEPAIVGIHGTAGSAYSLTALGERLAPGNRFIAMDLRGHGFSDKPPGGYGLSHHVQDVIELLDALRLERPLLLGFCLGGPVAAGVAARRDVSGLVLLEGAIGHREFLEARGSEDAPTQESLGLRFSGVEEYLRLWREENPRYSDEAERWVERFARFELAPLPDGTYRRRGLLQALQDEFLSLLAVDTLKTLSHVPCPVLIVRATQPWLGRGQWLTAEACEAQLQACRVGRVFNAPHSDHGSLIRDPEPELVEAIRVFSMDVADGKLRRAG